MKNPSDNTALHALRHINAHKVLHLRHLTETAYVVRATRNNMEFQPGQHLCAGPTNNLNMREYSIYSSVDADYLEFLVIEVPGGFVSRILKKLKPGQTVNIEGPFGDFTIDDEDRRRTIYLIATGTGISPYHCFVRSYPELAVTVLHGVRTHKALYDRQVFNSSLINYIPCISQEEITELPEEISSQAFQGRVTQYLKETPIESNGTFFLCGNCDMIYEAYDILQGEGVPSERIKTEVYF